MCKNGTQWFPRVTKFSDYKNGAAKATIKRFCVIHGFVQIRKKWYWFLYMTTKLVSFVTTHLAMALCSKTTNPFETRRDAFILFSFYYLYSLHACIIHSRIHSWHVCLQFHLRVTYLKTAVVAHANRYPIRRIRLFLFMFANLFVGWSLFLFHYYYNAPYPRHFSAYNYILTSTFTPHQ